jgi:membrane protease YdiL (CAAX protease family)
MSIELGENPWILIGLTIFEILFVIVPAALSSKFEKISFRDAIRDMGLKKNEDLFIKIISGLSFGILFFFFGNYIVIFFRDIIVSNLLGSEFVELGQEGVISTSPIQPTFIQVIILLILQLIIVGPCEEAFFRGFLIPKLKIKLKLIYSIIISSIIFTIYHIPPIIVPLATSITYFGYFFTFGVVLSLIYVYFNNSIIPCSIAHSFFNILILLV